MFSYHRGCVTILCRQSGFSRLQTEHPNSLLTRPSNGLFSGSLPCTCDQYHELSSQTRHGHKCIPSCQYARSRCKTVQGYCKLQYSQCWPRPIGLALSLQPFANRGEKVSQTSSNPRFENPPPTDNEQPSLMGTPTWTPWHKL